MSFTSRFLSIACLFLSSLAFVNQTSAKEPAAYDPSPNVMHHIGDAHEFHLFGPFVVPLPCILYAPDKGVSLFMSSKFEEGSKAVDGYALDHGLVKRIKDFPVAQGETELEAVDQEPSGDKLFIKETQDEATHKDKNFVKYEGKEYELEESSKLTGLSSWYDFSITKNVFSMIFATILLFYIFTTVAKSYKTREGKAPKGLQSVMEPLFIFVRDEIAKPAIGPKYEKYMPFICALFFFILINNVMGLIPIFPFGGNVMGNVGTTAVMALITFVIVNVNGNKHYWGHIFWMPGVPLPIKILMAPIEIMGIFIKPFTLLIRLFANIVAGHTSILILVSLIFLFGEVGKNLVGAGLGALIAIPFVAFMNILEILVAVLQAFIFALLSALYIGAAIEDHTPHVLSHGEAHEHAME